MKQHKIPIVYLNQFGYLYQQQSFISVWKIGENFTRRKSIESFNKEVNIFDLPLKDIIEKRLLETLNGQLETFYPRIINDLYLQEKLSSISEGILVQIIPNFLCRSDIFRNFVNEVLESNERMMLLNEICTFHDLEKKKKFESYINLERDKIDTNVILSFIMEHLMVLLSRWNYIIIKDFSDRGWLTSDTPILLENNLDDTYIFPIETEIYFPLSRHYLVYLYHDNSNNKSNDLRKLGNKVIIQSDEELHKKLCDKIWRNAFEYVIFPYNVDKIKFD